ncbi:MAG: peptidylprolyl isomerase [Solobacterium sp.]|nr:peptidylprolyl isomerase [Solobacterium sp.]
MNKMIKTLLAVLMATSLAGCGSSTSFTSSDSETENTAAETSGEDDLIHDTVYVEMDIEDYGKVVLELDGSQAPITVTNFVNLVNSQFYDGLTFHRIMDGFMVQGGDPTGTGFGGSSQTIKGEFAQNGVENNISHKTGVISMARSSNMDSASSQFFICVADDEFLDGSYAAFGHVSEGLDVMMQIAKDAEPIDDNGTIPAENQPKINNMKVIEG